jgi:hypothetical protein
LEDTPRQTLDDASDKEHLQARGEEGNADGADHEHHAADHSLLVPDPLSDVSVDYET